MEGEVSSCPRSCTSCRSGIRIRSSSRSCIRSSPGEWSGSTWRFLLRRRGSLGRRAASPPRGGEGCPHGRREVVCPLGGAFQPPGGLLGPPPGTGHPRVSGPPAPATWEGHPEGPTGEGRAVARRRAIRWNRTRSMGTTGTTASRTATAGTAVVPGAGSGEGGATGGPRRPLRGVAPCRRASPVRRRRRAGRGSPRRRRRGRGRAPRRTGRVPHPPGAGPSPGRGARGAPARPPAAAGRRR